MIIKNLTLTKYDGVKLIDKISFTINENEKIALIGEEGNGKSTLIKAIYDKSLVESYVKVDGEIDKSHETIGYLPQHLNPKWNDCLPFEFLLKDNPEDFIEVHQYNDLEKFSKIMNELHIDPSLIDKENTMETLSGGEKVKIQLIKILSKANTILFLDEPTNDLDISTLEFLEEFLINIKIPVLFISHDETLLNKVSNKIIHLEQPNLKTKQKYTVYIGSYKNYVEERELKYIKDTRIANKEKAQYLEKKRKLNDIMNAVHYALNSVSRGSPGAAKNLKDKMHTLKAMEKRFDKELYSKVDYNEEAINVFFEDVKVPKQKIILDLKLDELKILNRTLIKDINLDIRGQDKLVIYGDNGTGKSILLKTIYSTLKDRDDLNIGYMPQDYMSELKNYASAIDYLLVEADKDDISYSRQLLGAMKFTREEMQNKPNDLSDGQKAKLFILKCIKRKVNVLILDEPTRNFSPLSSKVIRKILSDFNGCIISVSHDRIYINEVCNRVLELKNFKLDEQRI